MPLKIPEHFRDEVGQSQFDECEHTKGKMAFRVPHEGRDYHVVAWIDSEYSVVHIHTFDHELTEIDVAKIGRHFWAAGSECELAEDSTKVEGHTIFHYAMREPVTRGRLQ